MALKNKSMYAILGILNLSPGTGYDIKKYSDTVLSGFWNENFGHIYPTLKKLLQDGLIGIDSEKTEEKKVHYYITKKGRSALDLWLSEETQQPPIRSEFMLKLLFSSSRPKENTIEMLAEYKDLHENNIEKYLVMQKDLAQGIPEVTKERTCYINAVLRKAILSNEATIRWCEETIEALQSCDGMDGNARFNKQKKFEDEIWLM